MFIYSFKIYSFLILNYIILSINFFKVIDFEVEEINFKNVDLFFINLSNQYFKQFAFYLNSKLKKYNAKNNEIKLFDKKINEKKVINIDFVGSSNKYYKNLLIKNLTKLLENKYIFNFTSNNPDYLIYDIFNCKHLESKYGNAIKIAIYTENQIPDFNQADYAISYHNINYLDRYFRYKRKYIKNFKIRYVEKIRRNVYKRKTRKKFWAALISNFQFIDGFRIKFINELNKYKIIDMGGANKNNVGGKIRNKIKFLSSYKFSITMENTEGQGYISEKIFDSFMAGKIPIYYGSYMIDAFINPKA